MFTIYEKFKVNKRITNIEGTISVDKG